jgi:hypothetical protein
MKKLPALTKLKQIDRTVAICSAVCIIALAIGLMPYLFVRTSSTHVASFLELFFDFRQVSLNKNGLLYSLITSFFSDFCWAFAMPFFLFAFTKGRASGYFYIFLTPIIGSILELFQFFGVIDGVGDIIDAIIYFSASFLGYIILKRWILNDKRITEQQ